MIHAISIKKSISKGNTFLPPFIISNHYVSSLQKQTTYSFIVKADTPTVHDVENKKVQSICYEWGKFEILFSDRHYFVAQLEYLASLNVKSLQSQKCHHCAYLYSYLLQFVSIIID